MKRRQPVVSRKTDGNEVLASLKVSECYEKKTTLPTKVVALSEK
jgi:hypothetical protein